MNPFANYRATNCEVTPMARCDTARGEDPESLDLSLPVPLARQTGAFAPPASTRGQAQADDPVEGYVDEVLKPLYDKITELTQENAKLREALRKLREPMREWAVEEAGNAAD